MSTQKPTKLNQFLSEHQPGTICLATWMERSGISRDLQRRYKTSGWLETVGPGAYKRPLEEIRWPGALYTLQTQAALPVHAGAITALSLQGMTHYLRTGKEEVFVFLPLKASLPKWFTQADWRADIHPVKTSVFPSGIGLIEHENKTFNIKISSPERAILECLYLAPDNLDLVECYHLLEGMPNLRPKLLTELLEGCSSIKVKRLFLYMAKKAKHGWMNFLKPEKLDLGKGKRSVSKGGVFDPEFQIIIPRELAEL